MSTEQKKIPKTVSILEELELVPRATHRLISKTKEIFTKDQCFVHIARNNLNDDDANKWIKDQGFKVVTEEEAYPQRQAEQKKAEKNTPGIPDSP